MTRLALLLLLTLPARVDAPANFPENPDSWGKPWRPPVAERGIASYYSWWHAGKPMSNGEPFDPLAMTAASRTLPLGTVCEVVSGARSVVVRVTDRGPYVDDRIIDLSFAAMAALDGIRDGLKEVEVYAAR